MRHIAQATVIIQLRRPASRLAIWDYGVFLRIDAGRLTRSAVLSVVLAMGCVGRVVGGRDS